MTVTNVSTTCAVVTFRVKVSCIASVDSLGPGSALRQKGEYGEWKGWRPFPLPQTTVGIASLADTFLIFVFAFFPTAEPGPRLVG